MSDNPEAFVCRGFRSGKIASGHLGLIWVELLLTPSRQASMSLLSAPSTLHSGYISLWTISRSTPGLQRLSWNDGSSVCPPRLH